MPHEPQWQGTEEEMKALVTALERNCTCQFDGNGVRTSPCPLHREPLDQSTLDKLLFMRRIAGKLVRGEWRDAV